MAFPANFKIDKIIAFACGRIAQTLEDRPSPWADIIKRRVSHQHRLIWTRKALSKWIGVRGIQRFTQDPAYTTIDSELLKMHGITTIHDPKGFLMIDNPTLVISMAPNMLVKEIIAHIAQPAMIVWDIDNEENIFVPILEPNSLKFQITSEICCIGQAVSENIYGKCGNTEGLFAYIMLNKRPSTTIGNLLPTTTSSISSTHFEFLY
ncbi:TPA_exp: Uncharacterized protein A8136_2928 [Trichophyton benhamiae CBS 112371]|nr:TPA_exp: Uncharacterized protein A8136_2928 [Trichophyton benhamiae CBS 112371]